MNLSRFIQKHKWHIGVLLIFILIAIVSNKTIKKEDLRFKIKDLKENIVTTTEPIIKSEIKNLQSEIIDNKIPDTTVIINGEKYFSNLTTTTTVYQLMQNLSASSIKPFSFQTKEYAGMGHFVEEINGIKNNPTENKYWIYYINGESAKVGISNYIIHKGDVIEWKYENTNL